jgi:hypothetical protein
MNRADKLIVAGVVTVPVALATLFGILAIWAWYTEDRWVDLSLSLFCLTVAIAAGLITTGILLRKYPSK